MEINRKLFCEHYWKRFKAINEAFQNKEISRKQFVSEWAQAQRVNGITVKKEKVL